MSMTEVYETTLAWDVGEFGLIDRIRGVFPEIDLSDDCALICVPKSKGLLLTIDAGLRGTHFPEDSRFIRDAGWRTMAGAVSDINASGGKPSATLLALQIPRDFLLSDFDDFIRGVSEFSDWSKVPLVGGNITRGDRFSATVSVIGEVEKRVGRDSARIGDLVVLTGTVGGSEAGRLLALEEIATDSLDRNICERLIARFMRPSPPLGLGERLAKVGASAMIDISDGFLADVAHIAESSKLGISVEINSLPLHPDLSRLSECVEIDPFEVAAISGEEFELVFTISPADLGTAREIAEGFGTKITVIGDVKDGDGLEICRAGAPVRLDYLGWRHF
jgi:thiamine-monophosphate kinase